MREDYYKHKGAQYGMGHTRRKRILSLVPRDAQRILDIACAGGRFGKMLRERGYWVAGMDISEDAIADAQAVLDRALLGDAENAWPQEFQGGDFDVIIAAEILEHVFDPVAVLRSAKRALKPGGSIIITTPNFMAWTNRLTFLMGRFRYEEQGMFDFGHIRWFTLEYLKKVLKEAGFHIVQEKHIIFPGKLTRLLKYWPSLWSRQLIVRAEI